MEEDKDVQQLIKNLAQVETLKSKILKKMELAIDKNNFDDAHSWGQLLTMLPE